jgi:hypothetical protein
MVTLEGIRLGWEWLQWLDYTHILGLMVFIWCWKVTPSSQSAIERRYRRRRNQIPNDAFLRPGRVSEENAGPEDEVAAALAKETLLAKAMPASTLEERRRFLSAKKGSMKHATNSLAKYLEWRAEHQLSKEAITTFLVSEDIDLQDWNIAAASAIKRLGENPSAVLPQIARMHHMHAKPVCDRTGKRLVHILPGRMDEGVASLTAYALAVALYIDRKLDRNSSELVCVLIDARGGVGWRNLNAVQLMPFIKHTSKLLLELFPERLSKALVYPVPPALAWVWKIVRRCIDPLTRDKICLLTGPATIASLPPVKQMEAHLEPDTVEFLEQERVAAFLPTPAPL